jgi:hypothetical protein
MRRRLAPVFVLATVCGATSPGTAQTLSARPAIFADPILATDPTRGELVLGRTTLAGALRMFAVELSDSVRLPLGRRSNPDTLWTSSTSGDSASWPRPHHRLDIGVGRYTPGDGGCSPLTLTPPAPARGSGRPICDTPGAAALEYSGRYDCTAGALHLPDSYGLGGRRWPRRQQPPPAWRGGRVRLPLYLPDPASPG